MVSRRVPFALLALVTIGSGCAPEEKVMDTLQVAYVCAPPEDAKDCAPSGGECERYLTGWASMYLLDSDGSTNWMGFYVQVNNQRLNNENETGGAVNTADAFITSYEVSYDVDGYSIASRTVETTDNLVPAEGSATPFITLIPPPVSAEMQAALPAGISQVLVRVKMKGHWADGSEFETGEYKVATYVYNATAPVVSCPEATDLLYVCPNDGQTASYSCESGA